MLEYSNNKLLNNDDKKLSSFARRLSVFAMACAIVAVLVPIGLFVLGNLSPNVETNWVYAAELPLVGACVFLGLIIFALVFTSKKERQFLAAQNQHLRSGLEALEDATWELRDAEERNRNMSEAFGDVVMHRNVDGNLTYVNDALAELFECSVEDLIGKPLPVEVRIERSLTSGQLSADKEHIKGIGEVSVETPSGRKWFWWLEMPVRDETSQVGTMRVVARDISTQKEAELELRHASEKSEAASVAKSRFLANVSHEMRTPLNGILGMSRLLGDSGLTSSQTSYNDAIFTSGSALLTLIEDILDITKIEAGRFDQRNEEFALGSLVEEVCELLSSRTYAKDIEIGSFLDIDLPDCIIADKGRVRQVLINLVGNAIKFTETGGVLVYARVDKSGSNDPEDNKISLVLDVVDTGPGISPEDSKRIFGEFEQVETVSTKKHGGAGLGLSISHGIARKLGGNINLKSEPGRGSTFSFSFPCEVSSQQFPSEVSSQQLPSEVSSQQFPSEVSSQSAKKSPDKKSTEKNNYVNKADGLKNASLLMVSNNGLEAGLVCRQLKQYSKNISSCNSVDKALAQLADNPEIHRVILDVDSFDDPDKAVRKLVDCIGATTGLVVMLKPEMREKLDQYLQMGCHAYLIRPLRLSSLISILCKLPTRDKTQLKAIASKTMPQSEIAAKFDGKRVLLAEDNEINALLAKTALAKAGHDVTWVTNGQQAVDSWALAIEKAHPFDVVLMDLHMPILNGLDAIRKIREEESSNSYAQTRILALTADEQDETRVECAKLGTDDFLVKPLDPARLQQAITIHDEVLTG